MGEFKLETTAKATMVLDLMNKVEDDGSDYPLSYYIDAAKDYPTLEEAEHGLIKECPICTDDNKLIHNVSVQTCLMLHCDAGILLCHR